MILTKIYDTNLKRKLSNHELSNLIYSIEKFMGKIGFKVKGEIRNSQSIKLTYNKKQFEIDPIVLGYNTRYSFGTKKLTRVPSWDQRVKFNEELNSILDINDISCKVISGPFLIREGTTSYKETDWYNQMPDYMVENENRGFYVEEGNYSKERTQS